MTAFQLPESPEPSWAKRGFDLYQLERYGRECAQAAVQQVARIQLPPYHSFRLIVNFRHGRGDPDAILAVADAAIQGLGFDPELDHWGVAVPRRVSGDPIPHPGALVVLWADQESYNSIKFGTRAEAERRLREVCGNCELEEP